MTFAPATIQATRQLKIRHLDLHPTSHSYPNDLDPDEVGIVGDTAHAAKGTSYHLGAEELTSDAYSRRTARDRAGLSNAASAEDVGQFRITTALGTFDLRHYTAWLFAQCRASAPDTLDLREVIGTVDGKTVLRWDAERGRSSAPRSGEADSSHLTHTHKAWYRDSEFRDTSKAKLDERYLREIGVIEGDEMLKPCEIGDTGPHVQFLQYALWDLHEARRTPEQKPLWPVVNAVPQIPASFDKATGDAMRRLLAGGDGVHFTPLLAKRLVRALGALDAKPGPKGEDGDPGLTDEQVRAVAADVVASAKLVPQVGG